MTCARASWCIPVLLLAGCSQDWGAPWKVDRRWVSISSGRFPMGSPAGEPCRSPAEEQHEVWLTRPFRLMNTEVIEGDLWVGTDTRQSPGRTGCSGAQCPAASARWHDAVAYCNALSDSEVPPLARCYDCKAGVCSPSPGFKSIYDCPGYRLPTHAEWEHAYRAGTTTSTYAGDLASCDDDPVARQIGWYQANAGGQPSVPGTRPTNPWGLHDMAGNLLEWCHDDQVARPYPSISADPVGACTPETGRVLKGGSYTELAATLRAGSFYVMPPAFSSTATGFRCARSEPSALQSVLNTLKVSQNRGDFAVDLDGTGPKNQMGDLLAMVTAMGIDLRIKEDLKSGKLLAVLELFASSLQDQSSVILQMGKAIDLDPDPSSFRGGALLGLDRSAEAMGVVRGSLAAGHLRLNGDAIPLPLPSSIVLPNETVHLRRAVLEADVSTSGLSNGVMAGVITAADLEDKIIPGVAQAFNAMLVSKWVTPVQKALLLESVDKDRDEHITPAEVRDNLVAKLLTPDIDLDGDGQPDGYSIGFGFTTVPCKIQR